MGELAAALPDQNTWVDTFRSYQAESVAHFMVELEYDEEPECLTMRLCLNLEDEMTLYCPWWLWHNRAALLSRCHSFQRQHHFFPHLGVILAAPWPWQSAVRLAPLEPPGPLEPLGPLEPQESRAPGAPGAKTSTTQVAPQGPGGGKVGRSRAATQPSTVGCWALWSSLLQL